MFRVTADYPILVVSTIILSWFELKSLKCGMPFQDCFELDLL
jgi:hypothetical protein